RVLVADNSGVLRCVSLRTSQDLWRREIGADVWSLTIQPQGVYFAAFFGNRPEVEVRDLSTGELVRRLSHSSTLTTVAWSADGKTLAVGVENGRIYVWDVASDAEPLSWRGHDDSVVSLGFAPSGRWLLSASWDASIRLWTLPAYRLAVLARGYEPLYQTQFS